MRVVQRLKEINREFEPAEEEQFRRAQELKLLGYIKLLMILILVFQVYNIFYALVYTGFRLESLASRVYVCFYLAMLLAAALLAFGWVKKREWRTGQILRVQYAFVLFALVWGVAVTLYDQRVSENISVYLVTLFVIAVAASLRPRFAVPSYLGAELLLVLGLIFIGGGSMPDIYGRVINSISMLCMAIFVSCYRYYSDRRDFENHCIIETQHQEILKQSRKLDEIANHDSMTGLPNRRLLTAYLDRMFHTGWEGNQTVSVYMIDIDNFKDYNDRFGHLTGDQCLAQVAKALELCLPAGMIFRYGGEEFLCVVPGAGERQSEDLGQMLRESVEHLKLPAAAEGRMVTVSVGLAYGTAPHEEAWNWLLGQADRALYRAKAQGRDRFVRI